MNIGGEDITDYEVKETLNVMRGGDIGNCCSEGYIKSDWEEQLGGAVIINREILISLCMLKAFVTLKERRLLQTFRWGDCTKPNQPEQELAQLISFSIPNVLKQSLDKWGALFCIVIFQNNCSQSLTVLILLSLLSIH